MIFAPSREYCGLALELKKEGTTIVVTRGPRKGQITADEHIQGQARTLSTLKKGGWFATFGVGYDQTIKIIDWYFGQEQLAF